MVREVRGAGSVRINGPALRVIRELVGVSCSALARSVGADVSFLARVERGEKRGMRRETYERICAALRLRDGRALLVDPFAAADLPVDHTRDQSGTSVVPFQRSALRES